MKKVIIIGGGTAGLATGTYLQKNGYQTEIYESHAIAGGLCTAWRRKDFLIDGCLHWLTDVREESDFYQLYLETGAMKETTSYFTADVLARYQSEVFDFTYYTNLDQLERELKRVCSYLIEIDEQNKQLYEYDLNNFLNIVHDARKICGLTYPIVEMTKAKKSIRVLMKWAFTYRKQMKIIKKYQKQTVGDLKAQFKSEAFQTMFQVTSIIPEAMSAVPLMIYLAGYHDHSFVYTDGGSQEIAKGMEEKYIASGGVIHFKTPVKQIILSGMKASGVELETGERVNADVVISAADGFQTINQFLNPQYVPQKYHDYIVNSPKFDSLVHIAICVNKDLSSFQTDSLVFPNTLPRIEGIVNDKTIRYYVDTTEKGFLKDGQSVLRCTITADYDFFHALKGVKADYAMKKQEIESAIMQHLIDHKVIDELDVAYVDVATPTTFFDYTKNYQGSFEGILMTPGNFNQHYDAIETIGSLYLVGQWWNPGGGIPNSIYSARRVVNTICKADHISFQG